MHQGCIRFPPLVSSVGIPASALFPVAVVLLRVIKATRNKVGESTLCFNTRVIKRNALGALKTEEKDS